MGLVMDLAVVLLLIGINGVLALSELALVSGNRARLAVLERKGVTGAARARRLAEDPQRFLPTVQVGITLVGILAGVFGGARIAARWRRNWRCVPGIGDFADSISLALVVVADHLPDAGAGRTGAEAARPAPARARRRRRRRPAQRAVARHHAGGVAARPGPPPWCCACSAPTAPPRRR